MKASSVTLRVIACLALAAALLAGVAGARLVPGSVAYTQAVLGAVQALGIVGILAFLAVQIIVAFSGLLPASLIGITAGMIYGVSLGFLLACCSTIIGAFVAFSLSRSLLRPTITRLLSSRSRLNNFDAMLARDGWRFVFLMRLSPIMPFAATSYALGLSSIRLQDYWLGSLASLPSLLGYVFIGSLTTTGLSAISRGTSPLQWTLLGIGLVATAVITLRIGKLARLALASGVLAQAGN